MKEKSSLRSAVEAHPTGTFVGTAGTIGGLVIVSFNLTPDQAGLLTAGVSLLGTGLSWVLSHGGLQGLFHDLIHGTDEVE